MNGELLVVDDVPGEFCERVIEAFRARPGDLFALALSGGETARRCYERLAADGASRIDWWAVDVYWPTSVACREGTPTPTSGSGGRRCSSRWARPTPCSRCA